MKILSYKNNDLEQLAVLVNDRVYNIDKLQAGLSSRMDLFLKNWAVQFPLVQELVQKMGIGNKGFGDGLALEDLELMSPVPNPTSCRDGYSFRQHVETARRNRGLAMVSAFDEYPVFYFTNHQSIQGPGNIYCMPDHFQKLDFELEVAIVICKQGRNIQAKDADNYIGGLTIMNDLSARTLQMEEMLLNLGPAKGKDFATVLGPWLVTLDDLKAYELPCKINHIGKSWNISMACSVNGKQVSKGNLAEMEWTFAELVERASYGVTLYPGDVIGSGTVGTGCFLELNGTGKLQDPNYKEQWLQPGDLVEMEVACLGKLSNKICEEKSVFSLLNLKKGTNLIAKSS